MDRITHRRRSLTLCIPITGLFFGLVGLCTPVLARAQTIDSLTAALGSIDVVSRASAVVALARMPVSAIPAATQGSLIALLEREATGTEPADTLQESDADEAWEEYVISLTDLVRTLGDPRSLRGLALLGIETSKDVKAFVASFGSRAIAPLDEAWATKPNARPAVIATWGLIANSADSATQMAVIHRLLAPDDTFPIALSRAATAGNIVALVPFLDSLSRSGTLDPIDSGAMADAAAALRPTLATWSATQLIGQYSAILSGICLGATGSLNGFCQSSLNGLTDSRTHIQQGLSAQARQEIQTVIERTMRAAGSGALTSTQAIVLVSGLRQTATRIS